MIIQQKQLAMKQFGMYQKSTKVEQFVFRKLIIEGYPKLSNYGNFSVTNTFHFNRYTQSKEINLHLNSTQKTS